MGHRVRNGLLAQAVWYVGMVVLSLVFPSSTEAGVGIGYVPMAMMILLVLGRYWPLRTGDAGRVIAVAFGVLSMLAASRLVTLLPVTPDGKPWIGWALVAGVLLVLLTVVSFGRQMAREDRNHLIRSLSHGVIAGTACIAAFGWTFLPALLGYATAGHAAAWVALAVIAALAVAMGLASVFWMREVDAGPDASLPEYGVALLPVMLLGVAVPAALMLVAPFLG